MASRQCLPVCVLLILCMVGNGNSGKILVWYTEGSHWINMRPVLDALIDRGHEVTVMVPSSSIFMNQSEPSRYRFEPFNITFSMKDMEEFMDDFLHFSMYEMDYMSFWQIYARFIELFKRDVTIALEHIDGVVKSDTVMRRLKEANFDLVLTDVIFLGGELVAELLDLPMVFSLRFSLAHNFERHCAQLPAPPSFVPAAMSKVTDKMNFQERVWNFVFYAFHDVLLNNILWKEFDRYYSEILGKPTSACEIMGKANIWLIRSYWDFEFPRPLLPNIKFVGGIHCRPAKPLPEDMEEFVQSSGDDGIVVFGLGSMVKNITAEKGNMIASALAQIPQKVLWRYSGAKPETLGSNTRLYDWIPQNDLLGHPKTKAFITHGGANGIYEAIYHGVPMVGIPLFADQPDNMIHMEAKGAAIITNINFMKAEDLRDAVNAVINDPSYKENVLKLSRIHHDRPIRPLDEAVFWIEHTLRNKGSKFLRVQAHELTWYQYYCLDVLVFLLAIVLLLTLVIVKSCSFCFQRCCRGKTKSKAE